MSFSHDRDVVDTTFGFHPLAEDAAGMLASSEFTQFLVLGGGVPDVGHLVDDIRWIGSAQTGLPAGCYWFAVDGGNLALLVGDGVFDTQPARVDAANAIADDHWLVAALSWFDQFWEAARKVSLPTYSPGDDVLTRQTGQDARIRSRRFRAGQWVYEVRLDGRSQLVTEGHLQPLPDSSTPQDWIKGPRDEANRFVATITRAKLLGEFTDTVFSFRATRTLFRPYQFKPVMKFLATGDLRLLVADEVGLGKTIEAGLLWTELEARRRAHRVLIVCPSVLVPKWCAEMEDRFGFELVELTPALLDDLYRRLEVDRLPPRGAYICSIERLRSWDRLAEATALGLQFDLAIVDEAHAFRNSTTKNNALGQVISQWADALVFLSATPLNLRSRDLYNLLELLAPGEFGDLEDLEEQLQPTAVLHQVVASLFDPDVTNADRRSWLRTINNMPFGPSVQARPEFKLLRGLLEKPALSSSEVAQAKRLVHEVHGLSASVTRTRKIDVEEDKTVREPHVVPVAWSPLEHEFYAEFLKWCVERAKSVDMPIHFVMQMPLRLAGSCLPMAASRVLNWQMPDLEGSGDGDIAVPPAAISRSVPPSAALVALAKSLDVDTKLGIFLEVVDTLVAERKRFLVFTFSRDVVAYLESHLRGRVRVAVMHGDVTRDERLTLMDAFRADEFDLVLATRVASEGLDFEFCSAVINYDLPWNPMEVEQRIGRIDRIGQKEEKILIYNLNAPDTIESVMLERVMARIGVFEQFIGGLEPIIGTEVANLAAAAVDFTLNPQQSEVRLKQSLAAIEEQKQNLETVEEASSYLMSSDGVDIDGLERDLVRRGKYIGQRELALLIQDWAVVVGGAKVTTEGGVLTLTGNATMAGQVQSALPTGALGHRADALLSDLRSEVPCRISLDSDASLDGRLPLLTAHHPLTRAALIVPGHRQARFASVAVTRPGADVPQGEFVVLLGVMRWSGLTSSNELWCAAADVVTGRVAAPGVGDCLLAALAEGEVREARLSVAGERLAAVLVVAEDELTDQLLAEQSTRSQENDALVMSRRISVRQVHRRKVDSIQRRIDTLVDRGSAQMRPLFEAQLSREFRRLKEAEATLDSSQQCSMQLEHLAVAVVRIES